MKRPLFAVGLVYLAATTAAVFLPAGFILPFLLAAAVGAALMAAVKKTRIYAALPLAAMLAVFLFFLHGETAKMPAMRLVGAESTFTGLVLKSEVKDYGTRYLVQGEAEELPGVKITMYLYAWEEQEAKMGDTITCTASFQESGGTAKTGEGIFVRASSNHVEPVPGGGFYSTMLRVRAWGINRVDTMFRGETRTMVKGILFGETGDMAEETMSLFRRSGAAHVLVVSGLHITILIYGFYGLLSKVMRPQKAAVWAFPLLFLLVAVEGFTLSVVRAAVMSAIMLLSKILGRGYDGITSWGIALLGILLFRPWAVESLSFWMSFGAVLGILLFAKPFFQMMQYWRKMSRSPKAGVALFWRGMSLLAASLAAQVFLFPIFLMFFHQVQVAAPMTSLIVLPLLPVVMVLALSGLILSGLPWEISMFFAKSLCESATLLCRLMLRFLDAIAAIPFAIIETDHLYLLFWYGGTVLILGSILYFRKGDWRGKAIIAAALCLFALEIGAISYRLAFYNAVQVSKTEDAVVITRGKYAAVIGSIEDAWSAQEIESVLRRKQAKTVQLLVLRGKDNKNRGALTFTREYTPQMAVLPPESQLEEELSAGQVVCPQGEFYLTFLGDLHLTTSQGSNGKVVVTQGKEKILP